MIRRGRRVGQWRRPGPYNRPPFQLHNSNTFVGNSERSKVQHGSIISGKGNNCKTLPPVVPFSSASSPMATAEVADAAVVYRRKLKLKAKLKADNHILVPSA